MPSLPNCGEVERELDVYQFLNVSSGASSSVMYLQCHAFGVDSNMAAVVFVSTPRGWSHYPNTTSTVRAI